MSASDVITDLSAAEFAAMLGERLSRAGELGRAGVIDELRWYQGIDQVLQVHMNRLAQRVYGGQHPRHWLWKSHKQFVLDRLKPGQRVLDVGCGASAYLLWMAEMGCKVTGCDIREDRIAQARSIMSHANLEFEVRDVTSEPPKAPFDVAICSHVIEHIDDPVPLLAALKMNAPKLIVCVPREDSRWQKLMFRDLGLLWKDDEDHRREYTPALLREQLERAGWRVTEMEVGLDLKAVAESSVDVPESYVDPSLDHSAYLWQQRERSERKKNYDSKVRTDYLARKLAQFLPPGVGTKILCLGSRNRCELDSLEREGFGDVVGTDLHSTDARIEVMDMHALKFPDGSFDGVFSSHSFEHARDPARVAWEIRRVLKPGGVAIFEVPTGYMPTGADLWDYKSAAGLASYFQPADIVWSERGVLLDALHQHVIRVVLKMRDES